jgi:hypothetical protein
MIHLGVLNFFRLPYPGQVPSKHYPPLEAVATVCAVSQISRWRPFGANQPLILAIMGLANLVTAESKSRRIADRLWGCRYSLSGDSLKRILVAGCSE